MAKYLNPTEVLDALLDGVAQGTIMTVCSAQPTNRTEAVTTYALADVTIDSGDFTKANGDVSGRKVTVAEQEEISIDVSGTATHVAICDGTNLLAVTTCTSQALVSGNTVTIPAWKVEVSAPS